MSWSHHQHNLNERKTWIRLSICKVLSFSSWTSVFRIARWHLGNLDSCKCNWASFKKIYWSHCNRMCLCLHRKRFRNLKDASHYFRACWACQRWQQHQSFLNSCCNLNWFDCFWRGHWYSNVLKDHQSHHLVWWTSHQTGSPSCHLFTWNYTTW